MKKCLFCAESIQDEAVKCRFCNEFQDRQTKAPSIGSVTLGACRVCGRHLSRLSQKCPGCGAKDYPGLNEADGLILSRASLIAMVGFYLAGLGVCFVITSSLKSIPSDFTSVGIALVFLGALFFRHFQATQKRFADGVGAKPAKPSSADAAD